MNQTIVSLLTARQPEVSIASKFACEYIKRIRYRTEVRWKRITEFPSKNTIYSYSLIVQAPRNELDRQILQRIALILKKHCASHYMSFKKMCRKLDALEPLIKKSNVAYKKQVIPIKLQAMKKGIIGLEMLALTEKTINATGVIA